MNNKSIITLISFIVLSMFYVAPASARALYLNVEVPKECGAWEDVPVRDHCVTRGPSRGKAGKNIRYECQGDIMYGNGRAVLETGKCGTIVFITAIPTGPGGNAWWSGAINGKVRPLQQKDKRSVKSPTHYYTLCKPGESCRTMNR
jgi:hypothetical protein